MEKNEWTDARIRPWEAVLEQLIETGPGDLAEVFARAFELAMRDASASAVSAPGWMLLVFWGADPLVTNQIGWIIADHGGVEGLAAFKRTGKPALVIDPVRTGSCDCLDGEWPAPKPQTDLAPMLGIAHTLYHEGLHDEDFLLNDTFGFDKFLPYLAGDSDGTPKTADRASEICGKAVEGAAWLTESGAASIPLARIVDRLENPGTPVDVNAKRQTYPDVKMTYWTGGNPFAHHQDRNRMVRAWQTFETVVVQDFQWTATARQADIVLPATTSCERNDIEQYGHCSLKAIVAMKKVIEPVFEARTIRIFAALAERLGQRDAFDEGRSEMDWIKEFFSSAEDQANGLGVDIPDFDAFREQGFAEFPVTEEGRSCMRYADFRADPLLEPLGTPTGVMEIDSKNIEKTGYDDCPPHPTWMEPVERLDGPGANYPLHVAVSHPRSRLHSQLSGTRLRKTYAIADREPCPINTEDAAARGIADGDVVRIFNDRGQMLAGAKVTDAIRPGVIRVNQGGWYDPQDPGSPGTLDVCGDVNCLTVDMGISKLAQANCGHTALADIEKLTGDLPRVRVFAHVDNRLSGAPSAGQAGERRPHAGAGGTDVFRALSLKREDSDDQRGRPAPTPERNREGSAHGIRRCRGRRTHLAAARQPDLLLCLAQRDPASRRARPLRRARPDRDGRLGQTAGLRPRALHLCRASGSPLRAHGSGHPGREDDPRGA